MIDVSKITIFDLNEAAQNSDLDAALLPIMNKAGITDGGQAGIMFEDGPDAWRASQHHSRIAQLVRWLTTESDF